MAPFWDAQACRIAKLSSCLRRELAFSMPYFSARCIKSAIESVFSVESLSGVPDEIPSRKASFVFCMSVVSIKKSLVCWKDITRNFEFENEEEKNSGKEGEGQK